jgi:hypothetical protein
MTLNDRVGERDELTIILRLYHDLRDGRRSDEESAVRYVAKLIGATPEAAQHAMAGFALLDPRRSEGSNRASPSVELIAVWQELGSARARTRQQARNNEAEFWKRHGPKRMSFDEWKAEVRRIWDHEGGGRRKPTVTPQQVYQAFEGHSAVGVLRGRVGRVSWEHRRHPSPWR